MPTRTLFANIAATTTLPTSFIPALNATDAIVKVINTSGVITFDAYMSGTGAITATVLIYPIFGSNPSVITDTPITLSLSGTTTASASVTVQTAQADYFAIVSAISGTGAKVTAEVRSA